VYDAFGEIAWQRWPVLETRPPPLAVGARGLFVERLDAPPVMWSVTEGGYVGDERLAPGGDHLILARNRAYQPRWGRFLQPDPHGTGVAVQPGLGWGGDLAQGALDVPPPFASLESWTRDGVNVHAYCAGDPINRSDPTGLFFGGMLGTLMSTRSVTDLQSEWSDTVLDAGQSIAESIYGDFGYAAFEQMLDAEWAMDWSAPDDLYTGSAEWSAGTGSWAIWNGTASLGGTSGTTGFSPVMAGRMGDFRSKPRTMLGTAGIYAITAKRSGEVLYIGRSIDLDDRMARQALAKGGNAVELLRNVTYPEMRGAEQVSMSYYQSIRQAKKNKIRGVSDSNGNRTTYMNAVLKLLGIESVDQFHPRLLKAANKKRNPRR
jgi:hypothetical protein